jgi:hypothetical protein
MPVDAQVLPFGPTQRLQSLPKGRRARLSFRILLRIVHQHCDPAHPVGLLRPRRERQTRRSAAEQRDELAPPDAKCHLIPPAEGVMRPNDSTVVAGFLACP